MGSNSLLRYLFWLNALFAVALVLLQDRLAYWPHDAMNYVLSGASLLDPNLPRNPMRENLWALLAGPIAMIHPVLVRVLGVSLFILSAYVFYHYLVSKRSRFAGWFFLLATLPTYALWISASGLSEPLAYLFVVLSVVFWLEYVDKNSERCAVLSALSAVFAFFVRAPLALIWFGPAVLLLLRHRFQLLFKIAAVSALLVLAYAFLTYLLFGAPLPSQLGMLRATSMRWFNATLIWYLAFISYPLLVFGVLFAPVLAYAYWRYRSDKILHVFLLFLVPYFLAMLFLAPKEPRYATVFIYPSAYVLARLLSESSFAEKPTYAFAAYFLLAVSSFWFVPGASVHVEYTPHRHWVIDFPSFFPVWVNDALAKVSFARFVCGSPAPEWNFIRVFYSHFYGWHCV